MQSLDHLVLSACANPSSEATRLALADECLVHEEKLIAEILQDSTKGKQLIIDTWQTATNFDLEPSFKILWAVALFGKQNKTVVRQNNTDLTDFVREQQRIRPRPWINDNPYMYQQAWGTDSWTVNSFHAHSENKLDQSESDNN